MSKEIIAVSADDINKEHELAQGGFWSAFDHALECGRMLTKIKTEGKKDGTIPHGKWEDWLLANVDFQPDTARTYMKYDKNRAILKHDDGTVLTIGQARAKLAKPKTKTDDKDAPKDKTAKDVFEKLTNADQKILKADMTKARAEIKAKAKAEAKEELAKYQEERRKVGDTRTQLAEARAMVQDPFTEKEFKLIRGVLHPDREATQARKQKAFDIFSRIESICKRRERKAA